MLATLYSKSFKLSFNGTWTENFQTYKLDLEKAKGAEIKPATFVGSLRKQRNYRKNISFCFINYSEVSDCVDHNKLQKILKEMRVPDHLMCLLRNLYVGQEATIRTTYGTKEWLEIGKGVQWGCILSPCLCNLYAEYIMQNTGLDESQAEIKIVRGNISNLRYAYDTTRMAEN